NSSGTSRTPRSRRHSSTAFGCSPVSKTTAEPEFTANTNASPCPTSQATRAQCRGGHPPGRQRNARARTRTVTTTAASTRRRNPRDNTNKASSAVSARAPVTSGRQGSAPYGTRAPYSATVTIQDTPTPGTWTNPATIAAQASESTDEPATTGRAPNAARAATREP